MVANIVPPQLHDVEFEQPLLWLMIGRVQSYRFQQQTLGFDGITSFEEDGRLQVCGDACIDRNVCRDASPVIKRPVEIPAFATNLSPVEQRLGMLWLSQQDHVEMMTGSRQVIAINCCNRVLHPARNRSNRGPAEIAPELPSRKQNQDGSRRNKNEPPK